MTILYYYTTVLLYSLLIFLETNHIKQTLVQFITTTSAETHFINATTIKVYS
jgi:hypothetical protein